MLIFEPEITRAVRHDVYHVTQVKDSPLPMDLLMQTVKESLPDSISITGVTVFSDAGRTWQVNLSKPRRSSLFIDPYTGQITGRYERIGFFSTMFKLHRWLLDSSNPHGDGVKVGKLLVGISTLIFVIVLLTGVVIWLRRARKNFRGSLAISFANGWKGFWKGLHVAGGMYALVLLLAMALTGLTWSFDWYRSCFYAVCGVEHTPRSSGQAPASGPRERGHESGRRDNEFGHWQKVYDELCGMYPDAPQITIGTGTAAVTLGIAGNGRASDRYGFGLRTGEVKSSVMYEDSSDADKLRGWIYSIHTGSLGGILTRILWLLGALLGASLPLTGYYIWIKHLCNKNGARRHAHV